MFAREGSDVLEVQFSVDWCLWQAMQAPTNQQGLRACCRISGIRLLHSDLDNASVEGFSVVAQRRTSGSDLESGLVGLQKGLSAFNCDALRSRRARIFLGSRHKGPQR